MRELRCALVVVGNEILSGKVQDSNAYFAARQLRKSGASLERIAVVPDEVGAIAEEVRRSAARFDVVITSGGVGPTHDDLTIAGVAAAFERPVVRSPELEACIRRHFGERTNEARLKMAEVPAGTVLNPGPDPWFPTVQVENVYILPGIPEAFEPKLCALTERFTADPYFSRTIYSRAGESDIAACLNSCLCEFPELLLGSYPKWGDQAYRVKLTLESKDPSYLERAFTRLMDLLPKEAVVGTD
ncbi:MAG: molybdopterin-binding protein [Deltaproteobacteria bacterium]|jgi:molybdenum cofactor synthesis domain-containing protein|nr:molybdopterin-binding protein [Deltaproteobacteria bacterium]